MQHFPTNTKHNSPSQHQSKYILQPSKSKYHLPTHTKCSCNNQHNPCSNFIYQHPTEQRYDDIWKRIQRIQQVELGLAQLFRLVSSRVIMLNELLQGLNQWDSTLGLSKQYSHPNTTSTAMTTTKYRMAVCLQFTLRFASSPFLAYTLMTNVPWTISQQIYYDLDLLLDQTFYSFIRINLILFQMHYCPDCLRKCWRGIFGKPSLKQSYDVHPQFEQEEFINPHHSRDQPIIKSNSAKMRQFFTEEQHQKTAQEEMSVKLDLKSQERDIQKLIELELSDEISQKTPQGGINQLESDPQQLKQSPSEMDVSTFSVNLDPVDPFYSYISEQSAALIPLLTYPAQTIQTGISQCGLQIGQIESKVGIALKIEYRVNCSYSFYTNLMRNQKIQSKEFSKWILDLKILEEYKSNLTRNSLKFKKFGLLEARDFEYLRFHNGSKGQNWQLYLKPQTHESQPYPDSKRCSLRSIIHLLQKNDTLQIKQYLQVDLGIANLSNVLPKIIKEVKDYYQNIYEYVQQNYLKGEEV